MAKKKKKKSQAFTMVVLLLVIILLVVGYFAASNIVKNSEKNKSVDESDVELLRVDTSTAQSLTYIINGTEHTLVKQGDNWIVEGEAERPLDQDKVNIMINFFNRMDGIKTIAENQDNLKSVGLDQPNLTVTLKLEDGATYQYAAGGSVITEDGGCYAIVQGFPGVYVLPEGYLNQFTEDLNTITQLPAVKDILANQITKIHIVKDGEERINITKDLTKDINAWTITSPYDSSVVLNDTDVASLAANYVSYIFLMNMDYNCTDYSQYGLDNPKSLVELEYYTKDDSGVKTSHIFNMYIGNQNEDGSRTYVRLNDSTSVCTISSSAIAMYTDIDAMNYVENNLITTSVKNMKKAIFTVGAKNYELLSKDDAYTFNGTDKEASDIGVFYSKLTVLEFADKVKEQVNMTSPVLKMSVIDKDNKETGYSFYEYDDSFYAVEHEGYTYFLIDKRRITDIITALKDL